MHKIKWFHLSDLHLGDDSATDTQLMRKMLLDYIKNNNLNFDYIFCTGDIKQHNSDYQNAAEYMLAVAESCSTPLEHFFIVPGNHDINISSNSQRDSLVKKLTDWKTGYYKSSRGNISEEDIKILRSGETDFDDFIANLFGQERADKYKDLHFVISTEHFNIIHLNSTITYSRENQRDFIVGTRKLMDVLDSCDKTKLSIILTHYSFDFLSQNERNEIETILSEYNVKFWLAGHEHDNLIRMQRDKFLECQCGNLVLQDGAKSCFLTGEIDVDSGKGEIKVHAWYKGSGWAPYPFARKGFANNSVYPFDFGVEKFCSYEELSNAAEAYERLSYDGNIFSKVNLNTNILSDLDYNGNLYINGGNNFPLSIVTETLWLEKVKNPSLSANALLLGEGGSGKSTMMYHQCGELLKKQHLALYISLQALEAYDKQDIIDVVLNSLYKSADINTRNKFLRNISVLNSDPYLILFIDGFNELSGIYAPKFASKIRELSLYHGIQIVVSSRLDFLKDFGMNHFHTIHTNKLREEQFNILFKRWDVIKSQKNLCILLQNPMMALLYADTCSAMEKHADVEFLSWSRPLMNVSDLLHNYYLAQTALQLDRECVNGMRIFESLLIINYILPYLSYKAERNNILTWKEADFEILFKEALDEINKRYITNDRLPDCLRKVKRIYRLSISELDYDNLYSLLLMEMVLLRYDNGLISFKHQIHRDYLAAIYLYNCLNEDYKTQQLWHKEEIHTGVAAYLKYFAGEDIWVQGGMAYRMLSPYRNKEIDKNDLFVSNFIKCWLSVGESSKNLSNLDLRHISLSEHLKQKYTGTINIDGCWLSKETLINDRKHDSIIGMCFSQDGKTLAAVSRNGLVSITNIFTQSQMIIEQFENVLDVRIGFDKDDYLTVKINNEVYKWSTLSYDIKDKVNKSDAVMSVQINTDKINELEMKLKQSNIDGLCTVASEDGKYYAVGFDSGLIQIWNVLTQECMASLSLSDSQIATVAFTKDAKYAAVSSGCKIVQIWDIEQGICINSFYLPNRITKLIFLDSSYVIECRFADGSYRDLDIKTGDFLTNNVSSARLFRSNNLLKRINISDYKEIKDVPGGNAILLSKDGEVTTWFEPLRKLNKCRNDEGTVTLIAICSADPRFAASYCPKVYHAGRADGKRRGQLDNQRLVKVIIVKTGQCQLRLPTKGRKITKLQFLTGNRIILAAYDVKGDILLWELHNRTINNKEMGKWEAIEIVRNTQAEPLEFAFPEKRRDFISAYSDGTIVKRPFSNNSNQRVISTIPGIDANRLKWKELKCEEDLLHMLKGYNHLDKSK